MSVPAKKFLSTLLMGQRVSVVQIREAANALGISQRALAQAKEELGVQVTREGFPSEVVWYLEGPQQSAEAKAEAQLLVAMWEYRIALKKIRDAKRRIDDLRVLVRGVKGRTRTVRPSVR